MRVRVCAILLTIATTALGITVSPVPAKKQEKSARTPRYSDYGADDFGPYEYEAMRAQIDYDNEVALMHYGMPPYNPVHELDEEDEYYRMDDHEKIKDDDERIKDDEDKEKEKDDHGYHAGGDRDGDGFSYFTFNGPVSGPLKERKVPYYGAEYNSVSPDPLRIDYEAHPDYAYHYGVHDPKSDNSHTHHESRSGGTVKGEYRVMQPDGIVRIVKYTSDPLNGFKANVEYAFV